MADDDQPDDGAYPMFDDLALGVVCGRSCLQSPPHLGVMEMNHQILEEERNSAMQRLEDTAPVSFRFDVYSPVNATVREQHGVSCELDIHDVLRRAWAQQQGDDLPSQNCYIEKISLEGK